jgi:hypothetical protein
MSLALVTLSFCRVVFGEVSFDYSWVGSVPAGWVQDFEYFRDDCWC